MKKSYDTFVRSLKELPEGQEVELLIRDLTPGMHKYDSRYVRAIISSSPEKLPTGDILWLRLERGTLHPQPWTIKITEELGELPPQVRR
jgi:phenylphosphate carboxylase gamma subunit